MSFVHLHTHSEYSLLEASSRVKALAKKAAEFGMPAVALTDNGNMFGAIEFYFACKDAKVKPIIGMDIYLAPGSRLIKTQDRDQVQKPLSRLVLLAQNIDGYRNLTQISSIGFQEGFYYKPRVDYEVLEKFSENIICLTGGIRGDVVQTFLSEGEAAALQKIEKLKSIFQDRLYLELNRTGPSEWAKINQFLISASKKLNVALVAANDTHYTYREDQMAQEVLICIGSNKTLQDEARFRLGSDQFYFKSAEQMRELFKDIPEALENSLKIADLCNIEFKLKDENGKAVYHLPTFPTEDGVGLTEEIRRKSLKGLEQRFVDAAAIGFPIEESAKPEYYQRLDFELTIIDRMGFNGYFLIVQDFINWAKENGIPVGPGRGSGAGSLVAYSLNITDLDPIPNFLLFERFLNPERISMPDFDIDFCQDRRQEVIQYVTQKYGPESVSQIITYGKLQTRAAIKDVGRVLGMTFAEVDVVTKLIPDKLNITIKEALEMEPRLNEMIDMNPQVATLIELAKNVEGLVRHAGIHAAGVIIADGRLVRHAPLYKGADGENVVQYDMKHAEKIGLIKFDFLGLKTLTHIDHALKLIERNKGRKILSKEIPMVDPPMFEMLSRGDTAGIFQFDGDGITDAIKKIRPSSFADVTAITSLYRPGPMANIPDFARRKNGESPVEYIIDDTQEVLKETYGIMVYQEQVMGIASRIAGYSLGEADMLRRAMGKKIKEEMDQHRVRFMKGAAEKGYDEKKSEELFDLMYKFADYGFNKSHAAAYSVITLQTAWLKCHYPAEFFAALLTTEMGDTDKIVRYVKDAQKRGLEVKSPHVNFSDYVFTVKGDTIYFGMGAIKGVGEGAVEAIMEAREKMPDQQFKTLDDFFNTVDMRRVNKKVIESSIKCGAFDGFGVHRAQLMMGYHKYLERAEGHRKDREMGQVSLFDMVDDGQQEIVLPEVAQWNRSFALSQEKEILGFYLSDHPLKGYEMLCDVFTSCKVSELSKQMSPEEAERMRNLTFDQKRKTPKKMVTIAGLVASMRELITKKGTRMAFAQFEDLSGTVELLIFPDAFAKVELQIKDDRPLAITGSLEIDESGGAKVAVEKVTPLQDLLVRAKRMVLHLDKLEPDQFERLQSLLKEYPGPTSVSLELELRDIKKKVQMEVDEPLGVQFNNDFLESVHSAFGRTDFIEIRS